MLLHNFKYSFKTLFKNKMLIFWTFAFPIILGNFFNMAFSDIEKNEQLKIIDIAIVETNEFENNEVFKKVFEDLSDSNSSNQLFNTKYVSLDDAQKLLKDNKITGYLLLKDVPEIITNTSGINETVFKYVVEEIAQNESMIENVVSSKFNKMNPLIDTNYEVFYQSIYNEAILMISENSANIKDISSNNLSYTMIEFYTLIAMACLYGGILGMVSINQNLPNMSSTGKRVGVSPVSKGKLIFSSVLASYLVQLIGLALLFLYTIFALKVDYGTNILYVIIFALTGSLAGLTLGIAISTLFKTNENTKTGIVISITMLGCFLSGMMGITMKYVIDKNIPIINKFNPANMITDGFYSLYYYDTYDRFYFNIISLLIFSIIMITLSIISLRRQKYDSI